MKASLHIQVGYKNGSSFRKNAFFTTPYKLMDITEDKTSAELQLMIMNSSPGILDGDEYDMKIEIENNASLNLHTQAYQRLFNMKYGAIQRTNIFIKDNAALCYLPHPSVPHQNSIFSSFNNFYVGNNSTLLFGEILTCGRKLNGEQFLFSKYHSITSIYKNQKLVIKENLLMQPSIIDVHAIGQLEGFTHQASMIWLQENSSIKNFQQEIIELLSSENNIEFGVTKAPINGLVIRILGHGAEQLYQCFQNIKNILPLQQKNDQSVVIEK